MVLNYSLILISILVIGFASFIQGYSGFGFGIISMMLFSFLTINLERISVIVTIVSIFVLIVLFFLTRIRSKIYWNDVILLSIGVAIGLPAGYKFILLYSKSFIFQIVFGVVLLLFCINGFLNPHAKRKIPSIFAVPMGTLSGFTSGAFVSGGPLSIIYLYSQVKDARDMKATLQAVFIIGSISRMLVIGAGEVGYSVELLKLSFICVPFSFVMLFLGHFLSKYSSANLFKKITFGLIGISGVVILIKGINII